MTQALANNLLRKVLCVNLSLGMSVFCARNENLALAVDHGQTLANRTKPGPSFQL